MRLLILSTISLILMSPSNTMSVTFKSSVEQTGLMELYTSEGCSSCPPADRWISALKDEDGLWNEFIPMSFHVDYWDYIGWKDRFASPQNSDRQRQYAKEKSLKTVYTPGFVYNGQEWRGWFARRFRQLPAGQEPGVLELEILDNFATARFLPQNGNHINLLLNVALLGFELKTQVKAGENRGRELPHDFVVLGVDTAAFKANNNIYQTKLRLPETVISAPRYAIVAWVSKRGKQAPIQATGGWIPEP